MTQLEEELSPFESSTPWFCVEHVDMSYAVFIVIYQQFKIWCFKGLIHWLLWLNCRFKPGLNMYSTSPCVSPVTVPNTKPYYCFVFSAGWTIQYFLLALLSTLHCYMLTLEKRMFTLGSPLTEALAYSAFTLVLCEKLSFNQCKGWLTDDMFFSPGFS